mmetsp:Transcript_20750/g.46785  ORF Transcript_20750/g.46785 Transcript_20750/m.46785 type:complete len:415 (-) Transcript_20750:766-2010(-)
MGGANKGPRSEQGRRGGEAGGEPHFCCLGRCVPLELPAGALARAALAVASATAAAAGVRSSASFAVLFFSARGVFVIVGFDGVLYELLDEPEGEGAVQKDQIVEGPQSRSGAAEAGALEAPPKPPKLQLADLVPCGLPRPDAVALHFGLHVGRARGRVAAHVLDGLLDGPALCVQARVHHEPRRPKQLRAQPAHQLVGVLVEAQLLPERLGVEAPALDEGAVDRVPPGRLAVPPVVHEPPKLGQGLRLRRNHRLGVVSGHGLVEGQGLGLVEGPLLQLGRVHEEGPRARPVARAPQVVGRRRRLGLGFWGLDDGEGRARHAPDRKEARQSGENLHAKVAILRHVLLRCLGLVLGVDFKLLEEPLGLRLGRPLLQAARLERQTQLQRDSRNFFQPQRVHRLRRVPLGSGMESEAG